MHSLDKGRVSVGRLRRHHPGLPRGGRQVRTERKQFGRPIASFQLVQDIIAQISVDVDAARLLTWRAADLNGASAFGIEASKAKYFASEAVRAANGAMQAYGGYGYVDEYPVQKYLRDARVTTSTRARARSRSCSSGGRDGDQRVPLNPGAVVDAR